MDHRPKVRVPFTAYIAAMFSMIFVSFAVMVIYAFSHLFVGEWQTNAPRWVLMFVPYVAMGLGVLSGWCALRQARRKAEAKASLEECDDVGRRARE